LPEPWEDTELRNQARHELIDVDGNSRTRFEDSQAANMLVSARRLGVQEESIVRSQRVGPRPLAATSVRPFLMVMTSIHHMRSSTPSVPWW
jgi:hypothetical protein